MRLINKKVKFLFFSICFVGFLSLLYSKTVDKKEYKYSKYAFYSKCLDDALPQTVNNGLVYYCSKKAIEELDNIIKGRIYSRGKCNEKYESHACVLKKSQDAFEKYVNATCKENKYGLHYPYCEMMLKKDRLKWLDKTPGVK